MLEYPNDLFNYAKKIDKLWELELLCRQKAIERSKGINSKFLFRNVDPDILNDPNFQKGMTEEFLSKNNLPKQKIIFEITEKTAVKDYINFKKLIEYYKNQGYQIALDDTGSGYSGLRMVMETYPHFIKLDMDLIRSINKDTLKQCLIKQFYEFSKVSNIQLIAEGIETYEELNELIDIGIPFGQGYLLRKPEEIFHEPYSEAVEYIIKKGKEKSFYFDNIPTGKTAGSLARLDKYFSLSSTGSEVSQYFEKNSKIQGVAIVEDGNVKGVLMKDTFNSFLSSRYGFALYIDRRIDSMVDKNPLIVDFETPIVEVSKKAMDRSEEKLYDYVIVTKHEKFFGIITVRDLLNNATQLEINNAQNSNPLTGLPGNNIINENITNLLSKNSPFSGIYVDLNNFKPYNDYYGFLQGDRVLIFLTELLKNRLSQYSQDSFLGHIGGDDFIILLKNLPAQQLCEEIIKEFDSKIVDFYRIEDRKYGFIKGKTRGGRSKKFPIIGISLGVIDNRDLRFKTLEEINEGLLLIKGKCKSYGNSKFCIVDKPNHTIECN